MPHEMVRSRAPVPSPHLQHAGGHLAHCPAASRTRLIEFPTDRGRLACSSICAHLGAPCVRTMKRDIVTSVVATMTTSAVRWNCPAGLVCQVRRIDRPVRWDRCRRERAIASANEAEAYEYSWRTNSPVRKSSPTSVGAATNESRRRRLAIRTRNAAVVCGNGRLANRKSDAYSRFLGPEEAVKDGSRFADGMPGPLPKKEKTPSLFIERRLDVDPAFAPV